MTVGSVNLDGQVTYYPTGWYAYKAGPWFKKDWSGADRPKTSKPVRPSQIVRLVRYRKVGVRFDPKTGRYRSIRAPQAIEKVIKAKFVKPKRRVLDTEPHPYWCSGLDMFNPAVEMHYLNDPTLYPSDFRKQFSEPTGTSSWSSNDDIAIIGKLREKIVGSDFDMGVFLAEAPQALLMIGDAASRIGRSIHYARRGNWREAFFQVSGTRSTTSRRRESPDVAAANWLELQYGWTPLLKDAESGAQYLATILNAPLQKRYSASRRISEEILFNDPRVSFTVNGSCTRVRLTAYLREDSDVFLGSLIDPLTIIWEKTPYSFVVDWFSPIGDYLQARGFAQNLKGTFVMSKKVLLDASKPVANSVAVNGWRYATGDISSARFKRWTFGRTILSDLDVPLPGIKPLGKIASWKHCANAVALLTQRRHDLLQLYREHVGET